MHCPRSESPALLFCAIASAPSRIESFPMKLEHTHQCSSNTPLTKGPTTDFLKDTVRLTGIRPDDPRSQTGSARSFSSKISLCDSDGHVGLGALRAQHRWSTRSEGTPRERATRSRLYPGHRGTDTRNRNRQPCRFSDRRKPASLVRRRVKAEGTPAMADSATRFLAYLRSKPFEPTEA